MKSKKNNKINKLVAKTIQSTVSLTDLSGQAHELCNPPAHEFIAENQEAQLSFKELAIAKMKATDSAVSQGVDLEKLNIKITNTLKNKEMSTNKEMLSQIKKNANDITSKSEALAKKFNETKKKEIVEKKFKENKLSNPIKKEFKESKKQEFNVNKKDILGDINSDKKKIEKVKTEHKPKLG